MMISPALRDRINEVACANVDGFRPLSGGCVGEVYRGRTDRGQQVVVKVDVSDEPSLHIEGSMLEYLATRSELPVPKVIASAADVLIMEYVEHDGRSGPDVEVEAADALASLHGVSADHYGFEEDTLIGGLHLPNPRRDDWPRFFAEYRLLDMGRRCLEVGHLATPTMRRLEAVATDIDELIPRPQPPSLIHGDIWGGNVLTHDGHLAALIDPAVYYADPEIELAFISLFHTFGERFYARYGEHRPIDDGFFDYRKDLYNLFPLLVHVRLFSGTYVGQLQSTLRRLGY